jgi:hypothetical protein
MSDLTHEINFLRREVRDARVIARVIIHRSKLSTSASLPRAPLTCSELEKITQRASSITSSPDKMGPSNGGCGEVWISYRCRVEAGLARYSRMH